MCSSDLMSRARRRKNAISTFLLFSPSLSPDLFMFLHIYIGKRSNIQDGTVLHVTRKSPSLPEGHPLIIGDDVTIGHKAMLHGCKVGNRILVGMGAIILDGAILEDNVILGAGSLVPPGKVLKSGFLYVGSPAKQARPLTEAELAFLPLSADNYVRLKNEYLQESV